MPAVSTRYFGLNLLYGYLGARALVAMTGDISPK